MNTLIYTYLSVVGDSVVFPIIFSKYKSFIDLILSRLDKAYLLLSLGVELGVGDQKKSEKSDFFW